MPSIKQNNVPDNNATTNTNTTTQRPSFKHLFTKIPHKCVIETDCNLHISDAPNFMNKTLILVGMVRDSETDIIAILNQLDEISCIFDKIVFIIYESNSNDSTPYILEDWSNMHLNGDHCNHLRYNTKTNHSNIMSDEKILIDRHSPRLIRKILFHNFINPRRHRIVRFITFRNMLLEKIKNISMSLGMDFDYVMMIDLDIKEFNSKSLFNDLNDSPYSILCSNGLATFDIMRDTFASVMKNGTWLYTYHHWYNDYLYRLSHWPKDRYQPMNSCFGGLAIYKDSKSLLDTQCKYIILEDIKSKWEWGQNHSNETTHRDIEWPLDVSWYLFKQYREPLNEFLDIFQHIKTFKKRRKICEHLAYHYCLRAHGYTLAISRDAAVYYFDSKIMAKKKPTL